jgi:chromosome segregation protein
MVAVDRAGACWRWDGLVTRAGAPNPAAIQLAQRRRLAAAQAALGAAREAAHQAGHKCVAAERDEGDAAASEDAARAARSQAETAFGSAARRLEQLESEAALSAARILSLRSVAERLQIARAAADREVEAARLAVESLPCPIALEAAQGDAERRAGEAAGALDRARESRSAARAHAAATRQAALDLAAELSQADVLIEAAAAALARAVAARDSALQDAAAAEAALDAQPDPSILAAELDRLSDRDASCRARETAARDRRQAAEAALDQARHLLATLQTAHVQAESRYAALTDHAERLSADYREAQRQHDEAARTVATLPDASQLEHAAQAARVLCVAARQAAGESEAGLVALRGERDQGERTLTGLQAELTAWQQRLEDADSRLAGLAARHSAGQSAARALASRPDEIDARSGRAGQALTDAEEAWKAAAARLEAAELHLRALANAERDAGRQAIQGRERQMRAQAAHEARGAALHAVLARVVERLGEDAVPDALPDLSEAAELRARRRFERLVREREEMGPVNLRAELELETLEARITALEAERAELGTAIAKLRGAIGHLNREGRERLSAVFTQVDQHFRALFTRMMGGGRAHLALTGSEDPLAAGLEIFAEPPGKKLSALSLLSGGEQALTALSLIFAVFRCTPAPVCVLDEVDAPLDDANVERFCSLLDEMVRETGTSFLVVTHHQLTMSRMDRLFGVTMQERGVSRLLSVDLRRAVAMAEPVMQAAE